MPTHQIDDLRAHLFDTLAALKDPEKPMEIERARAVADVAKVLVESAKVEVAFLKTTGALRPTPHGRSSMQKTLDSFKQDAAALYERARDQDRRVAILELAQIARQRGARGGGAS